MFRHQDGLGAGELVRAARHQARRRVLLGPAELVRRQRRRAPGRAGEVALFDQTSFAKIAVRGTDAEAALQYLCSNDVAVPPGRTVYTALLNDRGGYEADVTVTRIRWNEYLLVTSSAQGVHDLDLLRRGVPAGLHVEFFDVTSSYAVLSVMGPQSRALLGGLSSDDFSADAFPFGDSREVDLGGLTVRATRLTYVGELGWELYVPSEVAVAAFERLTDPANAITPRLAGYYAIESLRLEKGYRAFGRELGPDTTPVEAGLSFACKLGTRIAFRGREAVERQKARRGAAAGEPRRGRPCRVRLGRRAAAARRRAGRVRQLRRVRPHRRPDRAARLHRTPRWRGGHETGLPAAGTRSRSGASGTTRPCRCGRRTIRLAPGSGFDDVAGPGEQLVVVTALLTPPALRGGSPRDSFGGATAWAVALAAGALGESPDAL